MYCIKYSILVLYTIVHSSILTYTMSCKRSVSVIISDDHARVVLSGEETEDYINASYIDVIARLFFINLIFSRFSITTKSKSTVNYSSCALTNCYFMAILISVFGAFCHFGQ